MSFIDNEEIKTALIARLKAMPSVTAELPSAKEIRESQYQGTDFLYPNIRVRVIANEPVGNSGCYHRVQFGIQVHSEKASSEEAEHISGIIASDLNDACFNQDGVTMLLRITNIVPALRVDVRTWRSETLFTAIVS